MNYSNFLAGLKGKKIAMCGIGVSNTPLIKTFIGAGATVFALDRREREAIGEVAGKIEALGAILRLGPDYMKNLDVDIIFRTPGMNFNSDELVQARGRGIAVTSEMEVFLDVCPGTVFAVTGSDGKTTTSTLIAKMLETSGKRVFLGGNIGKPLLPEVNDMTDSDYIVVELSSFQLISMRKGANVAVVTNVAPNHLDVHKDMDEYIDAKRSIVAHQNAFSRTVLNYSDEITKSFSAQARGQLLYFSMDEKMQNGAYLGDDGYLYMSYKGETTKVIHKDEIAILGDHNVANYLTAITAVWGYVSIADIAKVAATFHGVPHRIEFVREVNGVKYYNDSIATSPTRTIAGLKAFDRKIILLAGGYDKHIPFEPMVPYIIEKVKTLILTGPTAQRIEQAVKACPDYKGSPKILHEDGLQSAVKTANEKAVSGDIVSLSPACASFDAFPNFAARGECFKDLVNEI